MNGSYVLSLVTFLSWNFIITVANVRVHHRDVTVLTLYDGKMTTGRRSSPVAQLKCTGGSARCSFMPKVVQCYNKGSDGYETQWECKTDMDNKYRFGNIQVTCEGYDYPDDPYILQGSCGLEYTIDLTDEGYEKQRASGYHGNDYHQKNYNYHTGSSQSSGFGNLFMLLILGGIFYMIYNTCVANSNQDQSTTPPPSAPPPYQPEQPGFRSSYTSGPPPPYTPNPQPGFKREYTQGSTSSSTSGTSNPGSSNYGFWSGAAGGGLLGYLFGRNSGSRQHYNTYYPDQGYHNNRASNSWFGNWLGGSGRPTRYGQSSSYGPSSSFFSSTPSSSRSSSASSSGTRTASGFGGTSRR